MNPRAGEGRHALVVGLGLSGVAAARALVEHGWRVTAVDREARDGGPLSALGVEVRAPFEAAVPGIDLLVKSPGVPREAPAPTAARAAGVPVWSEIELGGRMLDNPLLAITGTNGKTTTTELVAHLLRQAGIPARACGNQGTPLTGLVGEAGAAEWLVVEASSFQLEDIDGFHPRGAALLNIAPDHLDRHGDLATYVAAKLRLFENLGPGDLAILPEGYAPVTRGAAPKRIGAAAGRDVVAWEQGGALHLGDSGRVAAFADLPLRGAHNRQNMLVAAALAAHAGATPELIAAGLRTFAGVPHRLELCGERDGVLLVNDSKATNPAAAIAALGAYDARVRLIAGGRGKGTSFDELAAAAHGVVLGAYLIGESAGVIENAFRQAGIPARDCADLDAALAAAVADAVPGDVVLLAPACASFDQFASFEARGDAFRAAAARYATRPDE